MSKTTVIYHSADYDGIFCREIAKKFLPDAELIGWNFGDAPLPFPDKDQKFVVMDLPIDKPFGLKFEDGWLSRDNPLMHKQTRQIQPLDRIDWSNWVWIDHHKSAIEGHPTSIPGYRIDGVAACRLAWQWFSQPGSKDVPLDWKRETMPSKQDFVDRKVSEPFAIRLAGEYDIWDHRGDGDLEFQFGLDGQEIIPWEQILDRGYGADNITGSIVADGRAAMRCSAKRDADIVRERSFIVEWEGLKFLALTTARCNSLTFAAKDVPETGHDALMGFYFNGKVWILSLYHAKHRTDLDLSLIAVKNLGGGHRGACGFALPKLPFL